MRRPIGARRRRAGTGVAVANCFHVTRRWHDCCFEWRARYKECLIMSNAGMGLRLKQQLTLTPRLQQSVKLLELSALECVQELHQAIAQNPFLEESAEPPETPEA